MALHVHLKAFSADAKDEAWCEQTEYLHLERCLREHAGLPGVRIHDLRHTYASNAVSGGMPIQMVGKLLGHSQIQTTMRYAHLADDPVNRAAEENANMLNAALEPNSIGSPKLRVVG